ncbi:MAG: BMP family ABC transporter substrate-binding protein [Clostridia bacterium]|nr:BMP family ABC transporter substrate-binding protein [Clostridia bacterium]
MPVEHYLHALKKGQKLTHALQSRGEDITLPVLSEIVPELNRLTQVSLGLIQIPLHDIEGTATRGRTTAFARNFMPLLDPNSEFAYKWHTLYDNVIANGLRDPIIAYEYYNKFYVVEGNKRVSVMRTLDAVSIEAHVTRVLPEPEDSERYRVYQEFLKFYADSQINFIHFSHEGDYSRLYAALGKTPGDKWAADEITDLHSCYHRFAQAYDHPKNPLSTPDAFLKYIEMFGYAESIEFTPMQFQQQIIKIWPEFVVAAAGKPAALLNQPAEKQQTLLNSMLRRAPNPLRCAFVYNHAPDVGGWTYSHELGRKALESTFGSRIETTSRENISPQDAAAVIDELARDGYHVIFTASPVLLDACIKQSVAHPETKILNCSLLASYHNVRSYYLRIYEAKFILGAIAGAMSDNNRIGYIADYPIYGVPASINAFALGAQMTNPRATIYLKWSSILGSSPEEELAAIGADIISNRDISAPRMESRAFGLYHQKDGVIHNLAMPMWNWEKVYQGIARSILSGAWEDDASVHSDRALSYFMGMSTDAIDLLCSKRIPPRIRRLVDLLHERIRSGAFLPFIGPISDQVGVTRVEADVALSPDEIIRMDYLAENVVGRIPRIDELSDVAKALVSIQGVRTGTAVENKKAAGGDSV